MEQIEFGQSAVNRVISNLIASTKERFAHPFSFNNDRYVVTNDFVTVANDENGYRVEVTPTPQHFGVESARLIAGRPWVSEAGKPVKMRRVTLDAFYDGYSDQCIETLTTFYQNVPGLVPIIVCEVSDAIGSVGHVSIIAHVLTNRGQIPYAFKFDLDQREEAVKIATEYNTAAIQNQPAPGVLAFPDGVWR